MTALIETVRVVNGRAPLWPLHEERLRAASRALGFDVMVPDQPSGVPDRIIRFEIGAEGVAITTRDPLVPAPLTLSVAAVRHPGYPWKTTDRGPFETALAAAQSQGADDAILLNCDGLVVEASRWAVVWRRADGRIGAPPLDSGVLRSVARLRLGQILEDEIVEEWLDPAALARRPVAVLNAARGLVPVRRIAAAGVPPWSGWTALAARFWP